MPRTTLALSLQRLADTCRSAPSAGADIDEAIGLQRDFLSTDEGFTRRQLLAAGVVGTAAASSVGQVILAGRANATPRPRSQPTIAVVGAGISGMSAAMTLRDAGFTRVAVYEANSRIGGRTFTRSNDGFFEPGQWAEWGGELIDSNHKDGIRTLPALWLPHRRPWWPRAGDQRG